MGALSPVAARRIFQGVWICMHCNAKNRAGSGRPAHCRKCGSNKLRQRKKGKKKSS